VAPSNAAIPMGRKGIACLSTPSLAGRVAFNVHLR